MHYHKLKYSTIFIPIQWKYRLQYDKKVTLIFYILFYLFVFLFLLFLFAAILSIIKYPLCFLLPVYNVIQNVPRGPNDTSRGVRGRSSLITISSWRQRSAAFGRRSCSPWCKPWLHVVANSVPRTLLHGSAACISGGFGHFWRQK